MIPYRVELRCLKDTPEEEERARKQNRVLAFQTTVYPELQASNAWEAAVLAVEYEARFGYREKIWLFSEPVPTLDYDPAVHPAPLMIVMYVRTQR